MGADSKFLVLGSNSFSGATFCDHLAAQGHDVIATSRSDEPHAAQNRSGEQPVGLTGGLRERPVLDG